MDSIPQRVCSCCKNSFPATLEFWHSSKEGKYGLRSTCRVCVKANLRDYAQRNKEKEAARRKKYNQDNAEVLKRKRQENYAKNREKILAANKAYRDNNKDKVRLIQRVSRAKRRARELESEGFFTAADIRLQYKSQRGKCWHCGAFVGDHYHADHLTSVRHGGTSWPNNMVISCSVCNLSKGAKHCYQWNGRLL